MNVCVPLPTKPILQPLPPIPGKIGNNNTISLFPFYSFYLISPLFSLYAHGLREVTAVGSREERDRCRRRGRRLMMALAGC